ncbi:copper resistance CopC/CopD family protein [Natrarchaeobius oligotrophus]|uniref:Copper resistance protein CopC n=1 Tax=Natrarchaeobius chitinivorans TaxID=1679083 RepID=A0A3N6MK48_NATCH|nr:copper resistance protein CopC [Natrarchaeobius chitinivorans]RQH01725.1 copper resistance protein CopC [Natrarchaeobius chitinivorans]
MREGGPVGRRSHRDASKPTRATGAIRTSLVLVVVALSILALASVATPIAAHAYLSESDPANAEQVDELPDAVTLSFSGDGVQVADVTVTDPDGEVISGDAAVDPDDARVVSVPLEDADDVEGMYAVDWEVLADDGHTTSGSFFFSVGDEPLDRDAVLESYEDDEGPDEELSMLAVGSKGLVLVALVGLVGGPITAAVAVYPVVRRLDSPARPTRVVDRRLTRVLAGASVLLFASALGLGLARAASIGPLSIETLGLFLETPLGRTWLVQLAAAIALCGVLAAAVLGALSRRTWLAATAFGATVVAVTVGWTSHSATAVDRLQGGAVDVAHVGGAGLWVGGLVVLALVAVPALRATDREERTAAAAATVRRYSLLALSGVTLAGATGFVLAAWHVPSASALADTLYGRSLSAKTLLVLLALGLGGLTRFVLLRRLESPTGSIVTFARTVRLEVVVLVVVLLLSGLLTSAPTAAVVGGDDGPSTAAIEREGDDVAVTLLAIPAEVRSTAEGDDRFLLQAEEPIVFEVAFSNDPGGSDAVEATAVRDGDLLDSDRTVRVLADAVNGDATIEFELEETDDGTYATVQSLPDDGPWALRVTASPDGQFVSEWFDATVVPSGDYDHGDHAVEDVDHHDDHDHDDHQVGATDSPFVIGLQFGAIAVAVVGSVAVVLEAFRFGRRG